METKAITYWGDSQYKVSTSGYVYNAKGEVLNTYPIKGYDVVYLYVGKVKRRMVISRLMLLTFKPDEYKQGYQAHHINGNTHDNRLENLMWLSPQDNNNEATERRTKAIAKSKEHGKYAIYAIKNGVKTYYKNTSEFADTHNANRKSVWRVLVGQRKTYLGFKFEYVNK